MDETLTDLKMIHPEIPWSKETAQCCQFRRMIGILPVMEDGLPACRFLRRQTGSAVFPHRQDACFSFKKGTTLTCY